MAAIAALASTAVWVTVLTGFDHRGDEQDHSGERRGPPDGASALIARTERRGNRTLTESAWKLVVQGGHNQRRTTAPNPSFMARPVARSGGS